MNAHVSPPSQRPGPDTGNVVIRVRDLHAYYGESHILHGVSFDVREREVVSLLGRNGVGRSTTIKAIMGDVPPQGSITFKGKQIAGLKSYQVAYHGLGYVPEDRSIFPGLTVVVSPLISLMEDQVMQLRQAGVDDATIRRLTCDNPFRAFAREG